MYMYAFKQSMNFEQETIGERGGEREREREREREGGRRDRDRDRETETEKGRGREGEKCTVHQIQSNLSILDTLVSNSTVLISEVH